MTTKTNQEHALRRLRFAQQHSFRELVNIQSALSGIGSLLYDHAGGEIEPDCGLSKQHQVSLFIAIQALSGYMAEKVEEIEGAVSQVLPDSPTE